MTLVDRSLNARMRALRNSPSIERLQNVLALFDPDYVVSSLGDYNLDVERETGGGFQGRKAAWATGRIARELSLLPNPGTRRGRIPEPVLHAILSGATLLPDPLGLDTDIELHRYLAEQWRIQKVDSVSSPARTIEMFGDLSAQRHIDNSLDAGVTITSFTAVVYLLAKALPELLGSGKNRAQVLASHRMMRSEPFAGVVSALAGDLTVWNEAASAAVLRIEPTSRPFADTPLLEFPFLRTSTGGIDIADHRFLQAVLDPSFVWSRSARLDRADKTQQGNVKRTSQLGEAAARHLHRELNRIDNWSVVSVDERWPGTGDPRADYVLWPSDNSVLLIIEMKGRRQHLSHRQGIRSMKHVYDTAIDQIDETASSLHEFCPEAPQTAPALGVICTLDPHFVTVNLDCSLSTYEHEPSHRPLPTMITKRPSIPTTVLSFADVEIVGRLLSAATQCADEVLDPVRNGAHPRLAVRQAVETLGLANELTVHPEQLASLREACAALRSSMASK